MAPTLTYFPLAGRAWACRIALGAAGTNFVDKRLPGSEWGAAKADTEAFPMGYMPTLRLDNGKVFSQSRAIARYACKLGGEAGPLYPSDPEAAMAVDEVTDMADELLTKCPQDKDEEKKKELRLAYSKDVMPKYFNLFAKMLATSGGPFLGGEQLTLADLSVSGCTDMIASGFFDHVPKEWVDTWPTLVAHDKAVRAHPLVVKYGQ
mmetsp:Transcript_51971/g.123077  ORF Transcript_51971/g.123077 Transcript_51971/m.123077 type:complete len:206 (-) Transcript_51971:134-751(-)